MLLDKVCYETVSSFVNVGGCTVFLCGSIVFIVAPCIHIKFHPYLQAIGYSAIPSGRNEEGLVALVLKKKQEEVMAAQQQVVDTITTKILGKPNLSVCVEGVRPVPEDR